MSRDDAIHAITSAWYQRDSEFCVGSEFAESEQELREALRALGVTDDEFDRLDG